MTRYDKQENIVYPGFKFKYGSEKYIVEGKSPDERNTFDIRNVRTGSKLNGIFGVSIIQYRRVYGGW